MALSALIGVGKGGEIGRPVHDMEAFAEAAAGQFIAPAAEQGFRGARGEQHFAIAGKADDGVLDVLDQVPIGGHLGLVIDLIGRIDAVGAVDDDADTEDKGNGSGQRHGGG